ncbi:MAG: sigma-70 family RNA polymerase sigma factor [Acidobacteriota bacterium]
MIGHPTTPWSEAVREAGRPERETFLAEYAPLVRYIAARLAARLPRETSVDDLIGDGLVGLLEAVQRFDPSKGVQFSTFAEMRIRGAMLDGLRHRDFFPRTVRRRQREIEDAVNQLTHQLQRPPEDEEIGAHLGLTGEQTRSRMDEARSMALLPIDFDNSGPGQSLESETAAPDAALNREDAVSALRAALAGLPERDRQVLSLYYMEGLTLKEIGSIIGVTESRVCQIHTRAVLALRGTVAARLSAPAIEPERPRA